MSEYKCKKCGTFEQELQVLSQTEIARVCNNCKCRATCGSPEHLNVFEFIEDKATDPVSHPPHYQKHPSGVECITIAQEFNFNRGNAIKYIWRAGEKANEIEDLKKAAWYINREIQRLEKSK